LNNTEKFYIQGVTHIWTYQQTTGHVMN
jgi:hypothetical protein